jgi:hypothetical protein
MDFHIPRTKRELVSWLNKRYKGNAKFNSEPKARLLAIYINTRLRDK